MVCKGWAVRNEHTSTRSMTESETNLKPASRRDEIMPVDSFWFSGVLPRTFLGYHPPSLSSLPCPCTRPGPMANISAIARREGKIMICRCKHSCKSQGRSPVLDCPGRPYKPCKPCTPVTEHFHEQVISFDVRQGALGSRQSHSSLLQYDACIQPSPRQRTMNLGNRQHVLYAPAHAELGPQ